MKFLENIKKDLKDVESDRKNNITYKPSDTEKKVKKITNKIINYVGFTLLTIFALFILMYVIILNNFLDYIYITLSYSFFAISFYTDRILSRKYYTSQAHGWPVGRYFFIALINPKPYFKEENFNKGYLLYVISLISLFIGLCFLMFIFPFLLKSRYS